MQQMKEKTQMYKLVEPNKDIEFEKSMSKKNPETKQYLICIAAIPGSGETDEWVICNGRRAAYDKIVESIDYIDLRYSFVLVETCKLSDRKSVYAFMKYMENFYNEGFDIEDYVKGDWSESEYQHSNDIDPSFMTDNTNKFSMEDVMNGTVSTTSLGGDE